MESSSQKEIPLITNLFVAATLALMVFLAWHNFRLYLILSYEDHLVEWATVVFYLAAFAQGLNFAIAKRRFGDGLVAVYCLVAAGEEFNWGQRLLGMTPPEFFLAANQQQEINIHNFLSVGSHDLVFVGIALGYFAFLPVLARHQTIFALADRVGITVAPIRLSVWAVVLVCLQMWHPFIFSSEWNEAILASLFFVSSSCLKQSRPSSKRFLVNIGTVLLISACLIGFSSLQASSQNAQKISCARIETRELLKDLLDESSRLRLTSGHLRIFEASKTGLLDSSRLTRFREAQCIGDADREVPKRRQYVVDPWGMSYWLHADSSRDVAPKLTIYSFGPNRRRDSDDRETGATISTSGDDIVESVDFSPPIISSKLLNRN